jgi:magnesium transporter
MPAELADLTKQEEFMGLMESGDQNAIRDFLDEQNISVVAELISELPEQESEIISNLSIHRAVSTFKILDFPAQKRIIQELSPSKTAE